MRIEIFPTGFLKTNTYVAGPETSSEVLVIDPVGNAKSVLAYLRANSLTVAGIVNTHGHWDHISGNAAIKAATGAPILIHRADAGGLSRTSFWSLLLKARRAWSPPADRLLEDGDTIEAGSYRFEVIHTPGHTPGGICLKYKKTLFTGDTLMAGTVGRTGRKKNSWQELSASIMEKLFVLSDDITCYPGHGPKTTIERERLGNIFVRHSPETLERFFLEMEKRAFQHRMEQKEADAQKSRKQP